jgi:MFS family permease
MASSASLQSRFLLVPTPSAASPSKDTQSTSSSEPFNSQFTPGSSASDRESSPPAFHYSSEQLNKFQTEESTRDLEDDDSEPDYRDTPQHAVSFATLYTSKEEKRVVKRLDRRLVLFLAFLYLLSFLDRSSEWMVLFELFRLEACDVERLIFCFSSLDIGNARIAGLADDLRLSSSQYEWLLTMFYITYIVFEWMTLMYRLVPPHIYISLCVCSWGLIASFQSLATSFWVLVILRALLGIAEAAFGPGVPFYLSLFYKREELALRIGFFISAAPLASSFAGSLAWLIVKLSSNGPIAPWRVLFLVEGFPSVIAAVFAWMIIPDTPESARFLTQREGKVAKIRLQHAAVRGYESMDQAFNWGAVREALSDPKSYITAVSPRLYITPGRELY